MVIKNLPEDINVELLLSYLPERSFRIALRGSHMRNSYNDIVDIDERRDEIMQINICRKSLYNILPEYMFHPADRFSNLPQLEEKELFLQEYDAQKKEIENAYRFFNPVDLLILWIRTTTREALRKYTESNSVLVSILSDRISDSQRSNRFIRQALLFLPSCKYIRGDTMLLSLLLRKVFIEEGLFINCSANQQQLDDTNPRYQYQIGGELGQCFAGNEYNAFVHTYTVHYWSDKECNNDFTTFVDEVEEFRLFVEDYFLSVEEHLEFDITDHTQSVRLSDDLLRNYLNYNTNL